MPARSLGDAEAALDADLEVLRHNRESWVNLGLDERIEILDEILRDTRAVADRWISSCLEAKGLRPESYGAGEEWLVLAVVFRLARLLKRSLVDIGRGGRPRPPRWSARPDGQVIAGVFPYEAWDRVAFAGLEAEVWMEPGATRADVTAAQAPLYRDDRPAGKVALVLGAGNISALVPSDFLHKLFVEGHVVMLKLNPVNDYLGPLIEQGFRSLICRGFLRVVRGGAEEGAYLCHHPAVDVLHMTGSDRTFEAIIFGGGEDGARRRAERAPLLDRPFSAELGNITPVIVVPGPWRDGEIEAQAGKIATWFVHNASFNCLTPRVLIQHRSWDRREALSRALGLVLSKVETRKAYYPGAPERHDAFLDEHPRAQTFGRPRDGHLPWTLIPDVDPSRADDICFKQESFCSILAETAIEAKSTEAYISEAVRFANETLWGSLIATIIVHPSSMKDPATATAVDRAVADLRYGTVVVNNGGGMAYYLGVTSWGAFPGHDVYDVQSGIGVVNNTLMFAAPQKSVVRSPFLQKPDPAALTSRRFHEFGRRLALFEASPSLLKIPGVLMSAFR